MKFRSLAIMLILAMSIGSVAAKSVSEKIKVSGNCGMCESRIENAASELDGVKSADWNAKTKILEVKFDKEKTSLKKIQKAIAAVGHDTELIKADAKVYDELPGCCKYERAAKACCEGAEEQKCGSKCE